MTIRNSFKASHTLALLAGSALLIAGGCAGQRTAASGGESVTAPTATTATAVEGTRIPVDSTQPIEADAVTLAVKGLSCPQCASNIDRTLKRIDGVRFIEVDLAAGEVNLALGGKMRPSPARLSQAVAEAGFSIDSVVAR